MDDIDTHRANVGRHIPKQGKLFRAKIVPHLVFVNPPASPDGEQPPMDTTKGEALSPLWKKRQSPQNQLVTVRTKAPRKDQTLSPSLWNHW